MNCLNCDTAAGCGRTLCADDDLCSPSCKSAPAHCGNCPPWICDGCGQSASATELCKCWTSLDGMCLADLKALFAGIDLGLS